MHQLSIPSILKNRIEYTFNNTKQKIFTYDRRFSQQNGHLMFEGIDLYELGKQNCTPFYLYSEKEILRNIDEVKNAFSPYLSTRIFYASKACSILKILKIVKEAGICVEANSIYEIMKCLQVGFRGEDIIFNGVMKKKDELEYAIENNLYSINIDSFFELNLIEEITNRLKKVASVCIRIEPNILTPVHAGSITAFHAKAGIDLRDAEAMARKILTMPFVKLKGLHMHIGDQVPCIEPFVKATRVMVSEAKSLERSLGIRFDLLNVGGGIPVPYKYENGDAEKDYLYGGIDSKDFAKAIIDEVSEWRKDITIVIEPGRKIVSSAAVLLSTLESEKIKTNYDENYNPLEIIKWKYIDAGYSVLSDSLHFDWFFYLFNTRNIKDNYNEWVKIAGPLCDGGDYFHQGIHEDFFLMPEFTVPGDVLAFIDTGAYSIESQTIYNCRPRTAVFLINKEGDVELIRREDTYTDIINYDIY
jgi:D-ornithine/D-lysine decarboxylase